MSDEEKKDWFVAWREYAQSFQYLTGPHTEQLAKFIAAGKASQMHKDVVLFRAAQVMVPEQETTTTWKEVPV